MTAPRDLFEQACHEAITRWKQDTAAGTWQVTADNAFVDRLLRAWETSMRNLARDQYAQRGLPAAITSPQAAAARIHAKEAVSS